MEAYKLKNYQVSFSPAFPQAAVFYDIVAKADGDGAPTRGESRPMLQKLLAQQFKLKVHREKKEMPVYALVVGKNGPKFKEPPRWDVLRPRRRKCPQSIHEAI